MWMWCTEVLSGRGIPSPLILVLVVRTVVEFEVVQDLHNVFMHQVLP